jgi:hypothetical protein
MKITLLLFFFPAASFLFAQNEASNGNWKSRYVFKEKTPECEYMIRQGDIDNLGFGWEEGFNPFSGKSTPSHAYPWQRDSTEIMGYDMIMIPSSMGIDNSIGCSRDGYSGEQAALKEKYGATVFGFTIPLKGIDTSKIRGVSLQIFVDDFQSPAMCSKFQATVNGVPFPVLSKTLNAINQTGPIGKIITIKIPPQLLKEFKKPEVKLLIDDNTTGAADGFAIDFIKVMFNPYKYLTGNYVGTLLDHWGKPVAGATVECGEMKTVSTANGTFKFNGLIAGLNVITVNAKDYPEKNFNVDVEENQNTLEDLILEKQ